MNDNEETAAIRRCLDGDKMAFELLVRKYMRPAYGIALGYVGRPHDALDLSQDAFVNAYRHLNRFDPSRKFFPWFYSILRNLCLNHLTRRQRWRESSMEEMEEQPRGAPVAVEATNPETLLIQKELGAKIGLALGSLRPRQREIIILQHFQELSYLEIAELLDIPIGTVMSRLYSARRALREQLEAMGVRY